MHSSRRALELSAVFARQHQMDFHFSYVPLNYPFAGPFNFKVPVMQTLSEKFGPLTRAELDQASAIRHVHGDFHAEAKLGSPRSFPFHLNVLSCTENQCARFET